MVGLLFEVKILGYVLISLDRPAPAPHLVADAGSTGRLPEEGDVVGVSPEVADVPVDPGDGRMLVPQTVVTLSRKKTKTHYQYHHDHYH